LTQQLVFIGLDDTDTLESRGTGHLARQTAATLSSEHTVLGVIRHQLLLDPRVPYTAKNSSAAVVISTNGDTDLETFSKQARALVRRHFNPGSDPGLCVSHTVPAAVTAFGRRAQKEVVTQEEARALAAAHDILLAGLGGTEAGVIGALAAVGLAAGGEDGRYVMVGQSRELRGFRPVSAVLAAGIADVQTLDGLRVNQGLILTDKLRPARRGGRPVAVVEWAEGYWRPLKLD
jgi:tRNA(Ile2) C34 agmatinyltransferase TiaS